jgi:hypothetical protein
VIEFLIKYKRGPVFMFSKLQLKVPLERVAENLNIKETDLISSQLRATEMSIPQ